MRAPPYSTETVRLRTAIAFGFAEDQLTRCASSGTSICSGRLPQCSPVFGMNVLGSRLPQTQHFGDGSGGLLRAFGGHSCGDTGRRLRASNLMRALSGR